MIVNERLTAYLHSLDSGESEIIEAIGREARADRVPIIRQETGCLLKVLLRMNRPQRILEIGTAVGYSAILMSECLEPGATITTVEKYEKRIPIARENIKNAGMEDKITVVQGDALEEMKKMPDASVDFIFMDAAKAQYVHYLKEAVRLMKKGAVLVADNVFQEGDLIESRYIVTRRDRTIHSRMREYLKMIKEEEQLVTTIVPMGDGLTVSVKER